MRILSLSFVLFMLVSLGTSAQNDSVCANSTSNYKVAGSTGSTFTWIVNGGTQVSGGNNDSISIAWVNTSGVDTIKVIETSVTGCPGDTMRLAVVRLKPTAIISGTDSVCLNGISTAKFKVDCAGVGSWILSYNEDGVNRSSTVSSSPYFITTAPSTSSISGLKIIALLDIEDAHNCKFTIAGNVTLNVFPKPSTSGISRY